MDMLRILIVEDDPATCRAFAEAADAMEDLKLVGTSSSAKDALGQIRDKLPDVVILDMELHRGGGSGLEVLRGATELDLEKKPFFLITTVNTSNVIYEHARDLGADYIFYKHQEGYSEKYALDFLRGMRGAIRNSGGGLRTTEAPAEREERIRNRIKAEFYKVGLSPKLKGFHYLVSAVELYIQGHRQCLGDRVARLNSDTNKINVERAMQNAIDKAWKTADVDDLVANFKARVRSDKGVPTIMEFVSYYGDMIGAEY